MRFFTALAAGIAAAVMAQHFDSPGEALGSAVSVDVRFCTVDALAEKTTAHHRMPIKELGGQRENARALEAFLGWSRDSGRNTQRCGSLLVPSWRPLQSMRTVSGLAETEIAVHAQRSESTWKPIRFQSLVDVGRSAWCLTMPAAASVNMIDGQEFQDSLSAANARREQSSAVMLQHLPAHFPRVLNGFHAGDGVDAGSALGAQSEWMVSTRLEVLGSKGQDSFAFPAFLCVWFDAGEATLSTAGDAAIQQASASSCELAPARADCQPLLAAKEVSDMDAAGQQQSSQVLESRMSGNRMRVSHGGALWKGLRLG